MFQQGLELLVFGMGTVVVFLALLVLATRLMSAVVLRWFAPPLPAPQSAVCGTDDIPPPDVVAAIAAAVHRYRNERR